MFKGFTLIEVLISIALSTMLALITFGLGNQFVQYYRLLQRKTDQACLVYTAFQTIRTDLEVAPAKLKNYLEISDNVIHYHISDKIRLKLEFDEKRKRLHRIYYNTTQKDDTADFSLVLDKVEGVRFVVDKSGEQVLGFVLLLTHNGNFLQTFIKLRNSVI